MTTAERRAYALTVDGWLSEAEMDALWTWASRQDGPLVEIGAWHGRSTVILGAACAERGGRLYSVDHHVGSLEHQRSAPGGAVWTWPALAQTLTETGLWGCVVPIIADSPTLAARWTEPLAGVWIDGAHEAQAVAADIQGWSPHVRVGGWLACHDWPTVGETIRTALAALPESWVATERIDQIQWCERRQ